LIARSWPLRTGQTLSHIKEADSKSPTKKDPGWGAGVTHAGHEWGGTGARASNFHEASTKTVQRFALSQNCRNSSLMQINAGTAALANSLSYWIDHTPDHDRSSLASDSHRALR
jgi:hypothetical protein